MPAKLSRCRPPSELRSRHDNHRQVRYTLKVLIGGDEREVGLKGCRRDECVYIADEIVLTSKRSSEISIPPEDRISKEEWGNLVQELQKLGMQSGVIRSSPDALMDLCIDEDTGRGLTVSEPGGGHLHSSGATQEEGGQKGSVEEVPPHSSNGGVGRLS